MEAAPPNLCFFLGSLLRRISNSSGLLWLWCPSEACYGVKGQGKLTKKHAIGVLMICQRPQDSSPLLGSVKAQKQTKCQLEGQEVESVWPSR